MILPIYIEPQSILHKKTELIDSAIINTKKFQTLLSDMIETMHHADGIGLAAPQVGLNQRFTIINLGDIDVNAEKDLVLINPRIINKSFSKNIMEEGCLSIPGVYGDVRRPANITVKYLDESNKEQKLKVEGLLARVIQHEVDHLEGILFTEKVLLYASKGQTKPAYPHI